MTTDERLARLERENRWMRRIGSLLLAGAGFVLLVAQAAQRPLPDLKARSLTITDGHGSGEIKLEIWKREGGHITLSRSDGGCAALSAQGVSLASGSKVNQLPAKLVGLNTSGLIITDYEKGVSATLEGKSLRFMLGATTRARLGLDDHDHPGLLIVDQHGTLRAALGVTSTVNKRTGATTTAAESTLTLFDADGNVIWQAPR